MEYRIYHVLFKTIYGWNKDALVATYSKKRIPIILEEHIRKKIEEEGNFRKVKDIGVKILRTIYTGFKADKKGVIGYSLDELIIGMEIQKK